ncbi:hypothetical protein M9Y10_010050 [Tritrichomonas musculus]|uniref:Myb-like domain-containing protein n=1 Tax=Tritrichomonas musculus TaxID=1915356 RepID=A0ABR2IQ97_9EUKA
MSGEEEPYRAFLLNFDKFSSDDDDEDEVYKPGDDQTDDDSEDDDQDTQDTNQSNNSLDLKHTFDRFKDRTHVPESQVFVIPLPLVQDLPLSHFTEAQWDVLRHQCRLHFALLCRSVCFVQYCASSDSILKGILTLIHAFNEIFNMSVESTKNLNSIYGKKLFVPVLGDPDKSLIKYSSSILNHFLDQKSTDDIIEAPFMKEIFRSFQFNGEERPLQFKHVSPWSPEENELLKLAARRFKSAEDIQKYVMPGKPLQLINEKYNEFLAQQSKAEVNTKFSKKKHKKRKHANDLDMNDDNNNNNNYIPNEQYVDNEQLNEDDQMFVVKKDMKFTEVSCLPPSLAPH